MTFGQPEDVWLPQLEELLGLDFTNERLVARGSSLVGHEVIAYGLGREDLNGVRGTATDFDRKRGRCVVGFEGQTSSMCWSGLPTFNAARICDRIRSLTSWGSRKAWDRWSQTGCSLTVSDQD